MLKGVEQYGGYLLFLFFSLSHAGSYYFYSDNYFYMYSGDVEVWCVYTRSKRVLFLS